MSCRINNEYIGGSSAAIQKSAYTRCLATGFTVFARQKAVLIRLAIIVYQFIIRGGYPPRMINSCFNSLLVLLVFLVIVVNDLIIGVIILVIGLPRVLRSGFGVCSGVLSLRVYFL